MRPPGRRRGGLTQIMGDAKFVVGPSRGLTWFNRLNLVLTVELVPERVAAGPARLRALHTHEQPNIARVGRAVRIHDRPLRPARSGTRDRARFPKSFGRGEFKLVVVS